jgi:hypothetical protein
MQKLSAVQFLRRAFLKIVRKVTVFAMVLFSTKHLDWIKTINHVLYKSTRISLKYRNKNIRKRIVIIIRETVRFSGA